MSSTDPATHWCGCLAPLRPSAAAGDLLDELREWRADRSRDEWSDVWFALGRLAGAVINRTMVPMPFTGPHQAKIAERMAAYGCVRSRRHLVDGRCPSLSRV